MNGGGDSTARHQSSRRRVRWTRDGQRLTMKDACPEPSSLDSGSPRSRRCSRPFHRVVPSARSTTRAGHARECSGRRTLTTLPASRRHPPDTALCTPTTLPPARRCSRDHRLGTRSSFSPVALTPISSCLLSSRKPRSARSPRLMLLLRRNRHTEVDYRPSPHVESRPARRLSRTGLRWSSQRPPELDPPGLDDRRPRVRARTPTRSHALRKKGAVRLSVNNKSLISLIVSETRDPAQARQALPSSPADGSAAFRPAARAACSHDEDVKRGSRTGSAARAGGSR